MKYMCMKESKKIIVYDDYNSLIPQDQSVIGTVRQTFGHTALRNGFKIIETNMADQNVIELPSELKGKKFRIRKLTPKECFRLMGVDDKDIDKIQAAGISNSGQYKLAGNSIVVDVLFHLFRKMFVEKDEEKQNIGQQLSLF